MKTTVMALALVSVVLLSAASSPIVSAAASNTATSTSKKVSANSSKTTKADATVRLAAEKEAAVPTPKTITVAPGDYLTKIAQDNLSSVQRLYDANTVIDNPDLIFPDQVLTVPDEKAEIAHRDMPAASYVAQQVQAEAQEARTSSAQTSTPSSAPTVASGSVWDQLAACESGGNWAINTGNGYYGGIQFTLASWQAVGGTGYPNQASREEQILRGQILQARSGWGQWPACTARLGL